MSENKPNDTSKTPKLPKKAKSKDKDSLKSTKAQVNQRVSEVQALLLQGLTRSYILRYASKWKVSDRQVDDYIRMATEMIKEVNTATLQDNMGVITANLWGLFRTARTANNVAEAHKILVSIAKLKGLDQSIVNHIIEDKRELADMSDQELDTILNQANNDRH